MRFLISTPKSHMYAEWKPVDMMEDLNETYFGKQRWYCIVFVLVQVGIMMFVIHYKGIQKLLSVSGAGLLFICMFAVTISLVMVVSSWKDWHQRRKRLAIIDALEVYAINGFCKFEKESHDKELKSIAQTWSKKLILWIIYGVVGEAVLYLFFSSTGILTKEPTDGNFIPALILGLWWPICMAHVYKYWKRGRNLQGGNKGTLMLNILIANGCPYALYLRNFMKEANLADVLPRGPHNPPVCGVSDSEKKLLTRFSDYIPVFGTTNYEDYSHIPTAIRINAECEDWRKKFNFYAARAAIIIMKLEDISGGILYELEWIEKHGAADRTVLITTERLIRRLKANQVSSSVRWIISTERQIEQDDLPEDLASCLLQIKRKEKATTLYCRLQHQ